MKYTDNDIIDLMESICDVLEENTPEANVEERNKKFLEADKKANELTRLYRKAGEKFDKLVSQVTPDKEALRQARDTEEKLMQKMSDAHVIADKENEAQQDLKKQGVKGIISRETISIPKGEGYKYTKVLKTNEALKRIEEALNLLASLEEGMNLGDMIDDIIYRKKQEDPEADTEKLEAARDRAEHLPAPNDIHKDENGKWVKPEGYHNQNTPSYHRGNLATDKRRGLSQEAESKLRYERIHDYLNDYPKATKKSINRHNTRTNEAFKLIEEAFGLMTSLCEVDSPDAIEDTSKEHNYLKREIKNKDGSKTDVVTVEDELFPYAGNAKQQFNQKVIAKINDMIEGKATLEDLIQFISAKNKVKKVHEDAELQRALDIINDYINEKKYSKEELSKIAIKVIPNRKEAFDKACKVFDEILGNISASNIAVQNLTPIQQAEVNASADEVERTQDRLNHATDVAGVPESLLKVMEDLESVITKHHGSMFGNDRTNKGLRLHKGAIAAQVDELIDAAKRTLPDEQKNSSMALDKAVSKLEAKRANTKNKIGELRTDLRRDEKTPLSNKNYKGWYDQRQDRKKDEEAGYPKAIEKSIKRNKRG